MLSRTYRRLFSNNANSAFRLIVNRDANGRQTIEYDDNPKSRQANYPTQNNQTIKSANFDNNYEQILKDNKELKEQIEQLKNNNQKQYGMSKQKSYKFDIDEYELKNWNLYKNGKILVCKCDFTNLLAVFSGGLNVAMHTTTYTVGFLKHIIIFIIGLLGMPIVLPINIILNLCDYNAQADADELHAIRKESLRKI